MYRAPAPGFRASRPTRPARVAVPIADNEISQRVPRTNERRPDPLYSTNLLISNDAESWYDGVEIEWDKRLSSGPAVPGGLHLQQVGRHHVGGDVRGRRRHQPERSQQHSTRRANSRFHTPHRFTLNGSYRLPFFDGPHGLLGQVFGGWHVSGVVKLDLRDAVHVSPRPPRDLDFDGFSEARPVLLDPSVLGAHVDDPTDVARRPADDGASAALNFGDTIDDLVPRNAFFADGIKNVDLALSKMFQMPWQAQPGGPDRSVQRVQPGAVRLPDDATSPTSNFGRITGTAASYRPRVMQLVLRYRY